MTTLTINANPDYCDHINIYDIYGEYSSDYTSFPIVLNVTYGDTFYIQVYQKEGYIFNGWDNGASDNPLTGTIDTMDDINLTVLFTVYVPPEPEGLVTSITNETGTNEVPVTILSWSETQNITPTIRDVPTSDSGQFVDTGTFVVECRSVSFTCRFTDAEKDILNEIFNGSGLVYVYLRPDSSVTGWVYHGWIRDKKIKWEYKKSSNPDTEGDLERVWLASVELDIKDFTYYTDFLNQTVG